MKTCTTCLCSKGADDFHVRVKSPDGLALICKACSKIKGAAYYSANKERAKESARRWAAEHPERKDEIKRKYAEKPENRARKALGSAALREGKKLLDIDAVRAEWRENASRFRSKNPDKVREITRKARAAMFAKDPDRCRLKSRASAATRRARKLSAGGTYRSADIAKMILAQRGKCWWCSKNFRRKYHVDHRIPLAKGGTNGPGNLVLSCVDCNLRKHAKLPWHFSGRLL